MSVFLERVSLEWLVSRQLLIEILSENVAALSENVGWMEHTGWTERLSVEVSLEVSSVVDEVVDLSR